MSSQRQTISIRNVDDFVDQVIQDNQRNNKDHKGTIFLIQMRNFLKETYKDIPSQSSCCISFFAKKQEPLLDFDIMHRFNTYCDLSSIKDENFIMQAKDMLGQKQAAGFNDDSKFAQIFLEKTAYLENAPAPASR